MNFPSISHYSLSAGNPHGMYRSLQVLDCERDMYDRPRIIAGNNAAVFIVHTALGKMQLKCYIRSDPQRESIYSYIGNNPDPLLADARWHEAEFLVFDDLGEGHYLDVVTAPWIEGRTLTASVHEAVRDMDHALLRRLSTAFDTLAAELLRREWAHGDLKPDNIIVSEEGALHLIDYDALIFPGRKGTYTELGTPGYCHPERNKFDPDKSFDDYSVAIISSSLRAIAIDPELYLKFSDGDSLLFIPEEIITGNSRSYDEACCVLAEAGDFTGLCLLHSLNTPRPSIPIVHRLLCNHSAPDDIPDKPELMAHGSRWGYLRSDDTILIPPVFDEAGDFHEGIAVVKLHNNIMFILQDGTYHTTEGGVTEAKYFSEGLCAVKDGELWGFSGPDGKIVIEPAYESVRSFHEGLAAASTGSGYGYIDRTGTFVIEPQYDHAASFRNGKAITHSDGAMRVIDHPDSLF